MGDLCNVDLLCCSLAMWMHMIQSGILLFDFIYHFRNGDDVGICSVHSCICYELFYELKIALCSVHI